LSAAFTGQLTRSFRRVAACTSRPSHTLRCRGVLLLRGARSLPCSHPFSSALQLCHNGKHRNLVRRWLVGIAEELYSAARLRHFKQPGRHRWRGRCAPEHATLFRSSFGMSLLTRIWLGAHHRLVQRLYGNHPANHHDS
jgi:hypothetical protein